MGSEPKTRVVNYRVDNCDTYIGRPSIWGNPFSHHKKGTLAQFVVGSRSEAIQKYRTYILKRLQTEPELLERFEQEIRGKILGCFCKPNNSCHGDILSELASMTESDLQKLLSEFKEDEDIQIKDDF